MMDNGGVLPVEGSSEAVDHTEDRDEEGGKDCLVGAMLHGFWCFFFWIVEGVLADESGVGRRIHGYLVALSRISLMSLESFTP